MKPGKTKSIGSGAFHHGRYTHSIGGIAFFAFPAGRGTERLLLPGSIALIEGFGNLRLSLPPEAVLTMEVFRKQEIHRDGFQQKDVLSEQGIMHSYSIVQNTMPLKADPKPVENTSTNPDRLTGAQQKTVDGLLKLDREKFRAIQQHMPALPENASCQQKLDALFETIRIGGTLGIKYDLSDERTPKSPNEVLTPGKNGKLAADCDELALLFLAAARNMGVDVSDSRLLIFRVSMENNSNNADKRELRHAPLIIVGTQSFLFDPAFRFKEQVNDTDKSAIAKSYVGKNASIGLNNFTIVSVSDEVEEFRGIREVCIPYFRESAIGYLNASIGVEPKKEKAVLASAESMVRQGLILNPENKDLQVQAKEVMSTYQNLSKKAYFAKRPEEAMEYARRILDLATLLPAEDQEASKRAAFAENVIGCIRRDRGNHDDALFHFEKSLKFNPSDVDVQINHGIALCALYRFSESESEFNSLYASAPKNIDVVHFGLRLFSTMPSPQFEKVRELSEFGVHLDPKDGMSYSFRALAEINLANEGLSASGISVTLAKLTSIEQQIRDSLKLVSSPYWHNKLEEQLKTTRTNIAKLRQ